MAMTRSRDALTSVELTRLFQQLDEVLGEAGRLREQIARRLARTSGGEVSRFKAARKTSVRRRR